MAEGLQGASLNEENFKESKKIIWFERDGYTEAFIGCLAPPAGLRYRVVDDDWNINIDPPARVIRKWEPVTPVMETRT